MDIAQPHRKARGLASPAVTRSLGLCVVLFVAVGLATWSQGGGDGAAPRSVVTSETNTTDELLSVSVIPYRQIYDALPTRAARIGGFIGLIVWLAFLFAFAGITASDFFSPNLATLSSRLGLSEAVAGSTLLAFGNGSPDVFSTFAALRSHSGSLAVGELLGAAAFIVSFVAGSMCLVGDFKVAKHAFLRDVGFFLIAIILFVAILFDGHITQAEAGSMVVLYLFYVLAVAVGSWWHNRKMKREELMRKVRREYASEESYRDEPTTPHLRPVTPSRTASHGTSPAYSPIDSDEEGDEIRQLAEVDAGLTVKRMSGHTRTRSASTASRPIARTSVRPSLLSAVEFRDVVNSLRADSADERTLGVFRAGDRRRAVSAFSPRVVGHRRVSSASHATRSPSTPETGIGDPFDAHFAQAVETRRDEDLIDLATGDRNPWAASSPRSERPPIKLTIPPHLNGDSYHASPTALTAAPLSAVASAPAIIVSDETNPPAAEQQPSSDTDEQSMPHLRRTLAVLFPSLHNLGEKSILGICLGILSSPAILLLTLTLPVVDEEAEGTESTELDEKEDDADDEETEQARRRDKHIAHRLHAHDEPPAGAFDPTLVDAQLVHAHDAAPHRVPGLTVPSPPASPIGGVLPDVTVPPASTKQELRISHILVVFQCAVAPFFCLFAITGGDDLRWWFFVLAAVVSLSLGLVATAIEKSGKGRLGLCFVGFAVAVLWILTIVNEVVGVLQTIGHIFGLSDAIIGLTIFAVGNSLGDLVANLTIARMGYPVMAIAACYGGPMLNILLGVGISGSYFVARSGKAYKIKQSWTLTTTSVALLAVLIVTLIVVPMNGFVMTRKWGLCLMCSYGCLLLANVIIELTLESRSGHTH